MLVGKKERVKLPMNMYILFGKKVPFITLGKVVQLPDMWNYELLFYYYGEKTPRYIVSPMQSKLLPALLRENTRVEIFVLNLLKQIDPNIRLFPYSGGIPIEFGSGKHVEVEIISINIDDYLSKRT